MSTTVRFQFAENYVDESRSRARRASEPEFAEFTVGFLPFDARGLCNIGSGRITEDECKHRYVPRDSSQIAIIDPPRRSLRSSIGIRILHARGTT